MSLPKLQKRIVLVSRPTGAIDPKLVEIPADADLPSIASKTGTFALQSVPIVLPKGDEALVRVAHISLDPAMRGWLNDTRSYIKPVQIGEVMRAGGVGIVVAAGPQSHFKVGDWAYGFTGWQEYVLLNNKTGKKITTEGGVKPTWHLGPLGGTGQTAYWGLFDVIKPKKGELVVVSGAAGAVGTAVCQMAVLKGCKVVAIAGGAEKCRFLEKEIGVFKALDYKDWNTCRAEFKKLDYIDAYFDNVGGQILDMVLTRLQKNARIAICGAISQYNNAKPEGLHNYLTLISQRAKIEGFIVFDYQDRYAEAEIEIAQWIKDGKFKVLETTIDGLENSPGGLIGLFEGKNLGKMLVKVADVTTASPKL